VVADGSKSVIILGCQKHSMAFSASGARIVTDSLWRSFVKRQEASLTCRGTREGNYQTEA
jgi:hypothetical protein